MFLSKEKYMTLRSIYYSEIKKVRENNDLNEEEKQLLIKINQRRIELLNEEARTLKLHGELCDEAKELMIKNGLYKERRTGVTVKKD